VPLCKLRTEEVARIPGRAFGLLRDFVADEEVQRCGPRRRIEVASVVHVVIGSVVIGRGPVFGERGAIDRRVGALSSRVDFDARRLYSRRRRCFLQFDSITIFLQLSKHVSRLK